MIGLQAGCGKNRNQNNADFLGPLIQSSIEATIVAQK